MFWFLVPRNVLSQLLTGRAGTWETGPGSQAADGDAYTSYSQITPSSVSQLSTLNRPSSKKALFWLMVLDVLDHGSLTLLLWAYGKHD